MYELAIGIVTAAVVLASAVLAYCLTCLFAPGRRLPRADRPRGWLSRRLDSGRGPFWLWEQDHRKWKNTQPKDDQ